MRIDIPQRQTFLELLRVLRDGFAEVHKERRGATPRSFYDQSFYRLEQQVIAACDAAIKAWDTSRPRDN